MSVDELEQYLRELDDARLELREAERARDKSIAELKSAEQEEIERLQKRLETFQSLAIEMEQKRDTWFFYGLSLGSAIVGLIWLFARAVG